MNQMEFPFLKSLPRAPRPRPAWKREVDEVVRYFSDVCVRARQQAQADAERHAAQLDDIRARLSHVEREAGLADLKNWKEANRRHRG